MSAILCPHCNAENIEGVDVCDECGQSLGFLSKPQPRSRVERNLFKDRLRVLQPKSAVVVSPDQPIRDVLPMLVKMSLGCVLVVQDGKLLGIFSERDALNRIGADAAAQGDRPVSDFMTANPESLDLDDKIAFALHKMDVGHYRHLPILEAGKVRGVVSVRDIMRYLTEGVLAS